MEFNINIFEVKLYYLNVFECLYWFKFFLKSKCILYCIFIVNFFILNWSVFDFYLLGVWFNINKLDLYNEVCGIYFKEFGC